MSAVLVNRSLHKLVRYHTIPLEIEYYTDDYHSIPGNDDPYRS
jgi:hypothetical protein